MYPFQTGATAFTTHVPPRVLSNVSVQLPVLMSLHTSELWWFPDSLTEALMSKAPNSETDASDCYYVYIAPFSCQMEYKTVSLPKPQTADVISTAPNRCDFQSPK